MPVTRLRSRQPRAMSIPRGVRIAWAECRRHTTKKMMMATAASSNTTSLMPRVSTQIKSPVGRSEGAAGHEGLGPCITHGNMGRGHGLHGV
ncbi:hypothetical protein IG631_11609 [Alternaria alternata]|nr:hypothetical protein IG631_11609 [Alternaria alternata]